MKRARSTRAPGRTLVLAAFFVALTCTDAHAQDERASVRLTYGECTTLARARVRNILGAELGGLLIGDEDETEPHAIEVVVACTAERASLTATVPASGAQLTRVVELAAVHPLARERLVALAIAELITALGFEIDPAAEPAEEAPVAAEPPPVEEEEVVPEPVAYVPSFRVGAFGTATLLGKPQRGSYGAGLRFEHDAHRLLGYALALRGERGRIHTELGDVTAGELSVAAELTIRATFRYLTLLGAAGARIGVVTLRGDASGMPDVNPGSFSALLLAPHLGARAILTPTSRFFAVVGADVSFIIATAHALVDGVRTVNLEGPTLTGHLGLGVTF